MSANVFSDEDVGLLQEFINQLKRQRYNSPARTPSDNSDDVGESPDLYMALPQDSLGIPGVIHPTTIPGEGDVLGQGLCDIFRVDQDGSLTQMGFSQNVFNFSTSSIPRMMVPVQRSKYGEWVVLRVTEIVEGILVTELKPATGPLSGATMCDILVIDRSGTPEYDDDGVMVAPAIWVVTKKRMRVVNRSSGFKGDQGTYGVFENLQGEFRPLVIECKPSEEGVQVIVEYEDALLLGGFGSGGYGDGTYGG